MLFFVNSNTYLSFYYLCCELLMLNHDIMNLRVKEIAKEKGMQMQQLADILGFTRTNLTASINGNPTLSTLENIANALNVEVTELFDRKGTFTALIDNGGALHRFDSVEALEGFILELKTSNK